MARVGPGWPVAAAVSRGFFDKVAPALRDCDAVVLSDYGSGLVTPALADAIRTRLEARARRRPVPVLLDSRHNVLGYRSLTTCTPNESEVEQALGIEIDDDLRVLEQAGRTLLRKTAMQTVLITRGSRGMALFQPKQDTIHIPIFGSDEIADVTGAGDTVIATFGLALAAGAGVMPGSGGAGIVVEAPVFRRDCVAGVAEVVAFLAMGVEPGWSLISRSLTGSKNCGGAWE